MEFGPVVDSAWLRERLGEPRLVVVDCRWRLGEPGAGEREHEAGHVPGASFLDVDRHLSGPPGPGGRHPLPAPDRFEAAARRAGVSNGSRVVAYDRAGEGGAARLWWLLRHFGHGAAAVLDGGFEGWAADGGPVEPGVPRTPSGDFTARPAEGDTIDAGELLERLDDGRLTLLDGRAAERYRGEVEPIDRVAGRIPGARNLPFTEVAAGGRYLPRSELEKRLDRGELVAYCGSGVTACTLVLAATLAGRPDVRLYPGSWSEWSGRGLPVERG